jgi:anti-anti-sigma regulatory factor
MGVTLEQSETQNLLRLQEAVGIGCASEFKELLALALGSGREVRISVEGVTDLDVAAVQLLWAAERKAKGAGVSFSYVDAPPEAVLASLSEAGLQHLIFPVNVL